MQVTYKEPTPPEKELLVQSQVRRCVWKKGIWQGLVCRGQLVRICSGAAGAEQGAKIR